MLREIVLYGGVIVLAVLVILLLFLIFNFRNEIKTLFTLKQQNNYPFYTMDYIGNYEFDKFLETGAANDFDLVGFITRSLLKGIKIKVNINRPGCTTFFARNEDGDYIMGRNFDFTYSPSLFIKTTPKNGYTSMSMVNLAYVGCGKEKKTFKSSILTLSAPYLPVDGINKCGVAVSVMAIPKYDVVPDNSGKITLNTTTAVRMILDKASTADEAIEMLKQYDIYFSGGIVCHFLIADITGKSVIVEWVDKKLRIIDMTSNYQACTNFIISDDKKIGRGFKRYAVVDEKLNSTNGILSEKEAMTLLHAADSDINPKNTEEDKDPSITQWSIVYNMTKKTADIAINKDFSKVYSYGMNDK